MIILELRLCFLLHVFLQGLLIETNSIIKMYQLDPVYVYVIVALSFDKCSAFAKVFLIFFLSTYQIQHNISKVVSL